MSLDEAAEMQAAYESLFNGRRPPIGENPWPKAQPLVNAWCPSPRKRCRIGAVYATGWGDLWLHMSRVAVHGDGERLIIPGYTLLTFPDGSKRSFGHMSSPGAGCRHGAPRDRKVPFIARELLDMIAAVRAGRIRRPADYVAPWDR